MDAKAMRNQGLLDAPRAFIDAYRISAPDVAVVAVWKQHRLASGEIGRGSSFTQDAIRTESASIKTNLQVKPLSKPHRPTETHGQDLQVRNDLKGAEARRVEVESS